MLKFWRWPVIAAVLWTQAETVRATDYSDPTWPCIQRKVENLSAALMWRYPLPETPPPAGIADEVTALAGALALRRIDLEALRPEVERFGAAQGGDADALGHVFAESFAILNKRRGRIIAGIGDFSLSQIALSEQIDATRVEMDEALAADEPDFDRIDALEEKLDWDQIIFSDRGQSITYLCETPQLIERRLFAIAQLLASVAEEES